MFMIIFEYFYFVNIFIVWICSVFNIFYSSKIYNFILVEDSLYSSFLIINLEVLCSLCFFIGSLFVILFLIKDLVFLKV